MKNKPDKSDTIAVIGGGQLGYMLCEAARDLGIRTLVVTADADAPALRIADTPMVTPLDAPDLASRVASIADAVTFEFEAVPSDLLQGLHEQELQESLRVAPGAAIMSLLQNKARQKDWLVRHGFPTLPYHVTEKLPSDRRALLRRFGLPMVQKAQSGGYDGYGVQKISSVADLEKLWNVPSLFEPAITVAAELSVVVVRNSAGEIDSYAPVRLDFDTRRNVLHQVIAPSDLPHDINREALSLGQDVINQLGGVGVFAVEMFLTSGGELLINEISPRVHNTGHHTLEATATSQFEQHVRAVAGMHLGSTVTQRTSAMRNLLFTEKLAPLMSKPPGRLATSDPDISIYWYGKTEARPYRKMGHIICCDVAPQDADARVSAALDDLLERCEDVAA